MAGYSGKPLVQKLGIKPAQRVTLAGAPARFLETLEGLPDDVVLGAPRGALDMVLCFATEARTLRPQFAKWSRRLTPAGMLWIAWPKKSAKQATDLTENLVREIGLKAGLVDVKVCAIDATWSGLKFVRRLSDRGTPRTAAR